MKIKLPTLQSYSSSMSVELAIKCRETKREFTDIPVTLFQLSQLLWSAQGKKGKTGKLTIPSAGGQYPLDVFVVAGQITEVKAGIYKYNNADHSS